MKLVLPTRRLAAGLTVCAAATGSWALGVGRAQGTALVGRPLDVTVPITLDAAGEVLPECAAVDVFYGDSRMPGDRVTSELVRSTAGATLHVHSDWIVNEPVVTLYAQLGCSNRITRRVVLLAERHESQAAPQRPVAGASPARPAPAGRAAQAGARLGLEPLDLPAAEPPALRLSDTMARPQVASAQQRALAAAMWRALTAQSQDAQRLEVLERDLHALRQSIQRNDLTLADLKAQLQKAESVRYANPLVYALALLALAALGAAGWLWRQRGQERARERLWTRTARQAPAFSSAPTSSLPDSASSVDVELDLDPPPPTSGMPWAPPDAAARAGPARSGDGFRASHLSGPRSMRAEELHDVQQEADFFVSLGDPDRAIDVLRSHIAASHETSAMAWLDLLEIFHKLGRRSDFEDTRAQFLRIFNAKVPPFEAYRQEDAGLEGYDMAMSRIVALWPSPRVLDVIEESIFRGPGHGSGNGAFSLQAYRELLLLHNIGTEVFGPHAGGPPRQAAPLSFGPAAPGAFTSTSINPLPAGPSSEAGEDSLADIDLAPGLDINLDESPPAEPMIGHVVAAESHVLDFDLPDAGSGRAARRE